MGFESCILEISWSLKYTKVEKCEGWASPRERDRRYIMEELGEVLYPLPSFGGTFFSLPHIEGSNTFFDTSWKLLYIAN